MTGTEHDGLRGSGATPLAEEDPRRVGPVRLLGRLGAGGMGRVYLGVHEDRYVAVKQVLPSLSHEGELFLRRFGHELDNLARLPADSTAPLRVSDRTASPPWFATDYVPGITLGDARLLCGGSLPPSALWPLLREAAQGLVAVHALDMVHRDLKPSNVMLTADGATLIDFGVARAADQTQLTRTDMVIGTPAYMAPEQASGKRGAALTGAVDVFALGSVLACAATGEPPFGDESGPAVLYRIVHEAPDLGDLAEVDPELADVVRSCLAKRSEDRPAAAELLRLAEAKGPFTAPLWPAPVEEAVAERTEFARRPVPAAPPVDDTAPATAPAVVPAPKGDEEAAGSGDAADKDGKGAKGADAKGGAAKGGAAKGGAAGDGNGRKPDRAEPEPRRRTRFLPVIIPVVLGVGTTLLVQLLPYVTDADERAGGPGSSVSAPATAGAAVPGTVSGTPSGSADPSKSPGGTKTSDKNGKNDKNGKGDEGSEDDEDGKATGDAGDAGAGGADAGGTSSGSGGSGGSGGSDGGTSGGSSGGGSTGGSTTSGGSTGGVTTGPTIQNASTSKCLNAGPGNASAGSCSGAAASWSFRPVSGGVQIVSQSNGQCLASYGSVHLGACGTADTQVWTRGSDGTLRVRSTGECLGVNGFLILHQTCNGSATQRWR